MHLVLLVALLAAESGDAVTLDGGYVVIVHAEHRGESIPEADLAAVFLGRARQWKDRTRIESVDQSLSSGVRESFCRDVLNLEPRALLQYWQSQLQQGSGRRPPAVKGDDAEVLEWVAGRRGRIGYVSRDAVLGDGVKAIRVIRGAEGSESAP